MIEYAVRSHLLADPTVVAIIGGRMTPPPIPEKSELPCLTYTLAAIAEDHQEGDEDALEMARLQIDCWATSHRLARQLAQAVRRALPRTTGPMGTGANRMEEVSVVPVNNGTHFYEPDTKRHRVLMEFRLWYPVRFGGGA